MFSSRLRGLITLWALSLIGPLAHAEPISVQYEQGSTHGFVALRTLDGASTSPR